MDYAATIRFFARPETVAWVKRFAATVQTARTFYAEVEYTEVAWCGKRKLPAKRTQGYLEAALAELERPRDVWLDQAAAASTPEADLVGRHEALPDWEAYAQQEARADLLHRESFEVWVTRQALAARPADPLWQAGAWRYVEGQPAATLVARGVADAATLAALETRLAELRATPAVWHTWLATTIA